ncbi:MAG TPA: HAD family phosphatase [Gaiellales bacterium]|jgi:beta-phosphoglucomutase|nr:HAD family phosphatase [Gaiellales bacterium]
MIGSSVMPFRSLIFDFNGTLSDDEHLMEAVTAEVLARHATPPTHREYIDRLAGLSDEAMVRTWLGDREDVDAIVTERIDAYRRLVYDGSTVEGRMREVVRAAAERAPIGIVSGAALAEIQPVIEAAGIAGLFSCVVTSDDVLEGKPHPEGYLVALGLLRGSAAADLQAGQVAVIEDTEAGVLAAKAAGMYCLALLGTMTADRLSAADELVETIDVALVERLLG